jgi:hypothetical protein
VKCVDATQLDAVGGDVKVWWRWGAGGAAAVCSSVWLVVVVVPGCGMEECILDKGPVLWLL